MYARISSALVATLLLLTPACSSTSVNPANSGGAGGGATGGAGGGGGTSAGSCADNSGGLLKAEGGFETGIGAWYGDDTTSIGATAACGTHALELTGAKPYVQVRHHFNPPSPGSYTVSLCARAIGAAFKLDVKYSGPSTNDAEQPVLQPIDVTTSDWLHQKSVGFQITQAAEHTLLIAFMGGTDPPDGLIDCVSIDPQ